MENKTAIFLVESGRLKFDQMIEIGLRKSNPEVWTTIVKKLITTDLTADELIKVGRKAKVAFIWEPIIMTGKLNTSQLIKLGKEANQLSLWKLIFETKKIDKKHFKKIIPLLQKENVLPLALDVIAIPGMITKHLIQIGHIVNRYDLWEAISRRIKWKSISKERALEIGEEINNLHIYTMIIRHFRLSQEELLTIGNFADNRSVWYEIVQKLDFENFDVKEALKIGSKIHDSIVVENIIIEKNIKQNQLLRYMYLLNVDNHLIEILTNRINFKDLKKEILLRVCIKTNNIILWNYVFEEIEFSISELFYIGNKAKDMVVWDMIAKKVNHNLLIEA
ncbi:MAG: hypothetical protein NTW62_03500 [Candidatus Nomurabacteria bacterium]|nr:hypothetical protein [Candidatus Nomurabacteria bacterium]